MPAKQRLCWPELIQSGNRIFIGNSSCVPNACVPNALMGSLIEQRVGLHDIEVVQVLTLSDPQLAGQTVRCPL